MMRPIDVVNSSGRWTDRPAADRSTVDVGDRHDSACRGSDENLVGGSKMGRSQDVGARRDGKLGADVEN